MPTLTAVDRGVAASATYRAFGAGIVPFESLPAKASVSAQANGVTAVNQVSHLPGTFEFIDFRDAYVASPNYGFGGYFQPQVGGIDGSGIDQTVFQVKANSSTRAGDIPAQSTLQTNNLAVIRAGGGGSIQRATVFQDFTVRGTPQGHLYNGLLVYYVTNGLMQDVKVIGIPGNASIQPGETFGINDYHCNGMVYRRVEIDGRDYTTGVMVGASGFGGNSGQNLQMFDSSSHHQGYSAGFTLNTYTSAAYTNVTATDVAKMGFNFERVGGVVTMTNCTMLRCGTSHISIASDTVSATYTITDPVFDGPKLLVKCGGFSGNARVQDPNAITLIVNGVSRPDLMALTVTN